MTELTIGAIIPWPGTLASIPAGWQLADGTNSTKDLRNRFVLGAGGSYAVDTTGGRTTYSPGSHTHGTGTLLTKANTGAHTHAGTLTTTDADAPLASLAPFLLTAAAYAVHNHTVPYTWNDSWTHQHPPTTGTGAGTATGELLPPYKALYWIQRVS